MPRVKISSFAEKVLNKPLYPYQVEACEAILDSIFNHQGLTFSIMMARQSGKNQLSAVLEAYLLCCMKSGTIVKCAPTYRPQIINSRLRLLTMLDNPFIANRIWKSYGYIIGLAPDHAQREAQSGPRILFFSAGPNANIVGATASLLLEVDEAQDVSVEKFDRDLRPMASTTNATTVLYGTAWSDDTLLAQIKASNQQLEEEDGIRRHFQYDWRTLAAINPRYKAFVEKELQRLGEDHVTIRTQYQLLPISGAGYLLNEAQRHLLHGRHQWQDEPGEDDDGYYIAGMDVGGEERLRPGQETKRRGRDSTIISIARVRYNELQLPTLEVVWQTQWTGKHYLEQYAETVAICERWNVQRLVIDKTGLGEMMASLLCSKLGEDKVRPFQFTRPSKSKLTYQFLSLVNSGRLRLYSRAGALEAIYDECWKQLRHARYRVPGENLLDMYVQPEDGHDDYLISLALCCEALRDWSMPIVASYIVQPPLLYEWEGSY
jgi:Terminase RNaseH-like domain